jgi:hypothetical protein
MPPMPGICIRATLPTATAVLLLGIGSIFPRSLPAQTQNTPRTGHYTIGGTVVNSATGEPITRAFVLR